MKKRLAVIGGGAHTIPSYRELLKRLAAEYEVTVYSEFHLEKKWEIPEYSLLSLSAKKKNRRWREFLFFVLTLKSFINKKPHLIHSHSTYPSGLVSIILGRLFCIPVVVCLDAAEGSGVSEIKFGDILNKRRKRLNTWVINHASVVTALTDFQMEEVYRNLSIKKRIQVIPRGVDPGHYTPDKQTELKPPLRFLSVAYLHPVKDHETLLRAFQLISNEINATLTLVGEDYTEGKIRQLAAELKIDQKVVFAGFVSHTHIADYYHQADILLHTSLFESQAMAVVEAMANGVLVCGTRVGILSDLSGKCCMVVPVRAYQKLAETVLQLIAMPDEQHRMRAAAKEWVNTHSLHWTTIQYLAVYQTVL